LYTGLPGFGYVALSVDPTSSRTPRGKVKYTASLLELFLELGRIALNGKIQVADRATAGQVAHRSADQKYGHGASLGYLADVFEGGLLCWSEAGLQEINVVSHESCTLLRAAANFSGEPALTCCISIVYRIVIYRHNAQFYTLFKDLATVLH
jgi:hypothetical protein